MTVISNVAPTLEEKLRDVAGGPPSSGALPYFEFVLAFLTVMHLFETYLDWRQYQNYKIKQVPRELEGLVSSTTFLKAQSYGLAKSRFGFVTSTFDFVESLLVLCWGGLPFVWRFSEGLMREWFGVEAREYTISCSLLFLLLLQVYSTLVHLPFNLYGTFVLEEQFGFNKMTLKTFIIDMVKSFILTIVLGGPVAAGLLRLIEWGGPQFYLYCWLFSVVLTLVFLYIYPNIIAPLFNKFENLEDGDALKDAITKLTERIQFPLAKVFVVDGSTRSAHSNAYFYGFWNNKRIVLYDTLLEQMKCEAEEASATKATDSDSTPTTNTPNAEEQHQNSDKNGKSARTYTPTQIKHIIAIVGHELGHYSLSHNIYNLIIVQLHTLWFFFLSSACINNTDIYESFGFFETKPVLIGLVLFAFLYSPAEHLLGFLMNMLSRRFEFQADEFAINLGLELQTPLTKLHIDNLGTMTPDPWFSTYHYSHPTLVERLKAMDKLSLQKHKKGD
ncbi:zinc metalloprotease [Balamuthia mandrillaris]